MLSRSSLFTVGITSNALEWYDFVLYGYFAKIFGEVFFPTMGSFLSLVASFGVFAVAYLARPVGGLIFGHFGDKYGRKISLITSIIVVGISSLLMALLPNYNHIGIWAPILLTLIRFIQGFAVGGGFPGSVIYLIETSEKKHINFIVSCSPFGAFAGMMLASAIAALMTFIFSADSLHSYGWRIPYLLGGMGIFVGIWIHKRLPDSDALLKNTADNRPAQLPCREVFSKQYLDIFKAIALCCGYSVFTYIPFIYASTYLNTYFNMPMSEALFSNTIGMIILTLMLPVAGWLADKYSRSKVLYTDLFAMVLAGFPVFYLLAHNNLLYTASAQILFALLLAPLQALVPIVLIQLFTVNTRYTGISFAYHLAMSLFGGTAPLISILLIRWSGFVLAPGFYLVVTAVASAISFWAITKNKQNALPG